MSLETVVLAVGPSDTDRIDELETTTGDIAGPAGAAVNLVHVFTREEYDSIRDRLNIEPDSEQTPDDVAKRHNVVRSASSALEERGIDVTITGRIGNHGEEIVEFAKDADADLVVVGGRRRSPTGKAIIGSTAQRVMLDAPAPVTFVRVD